MKIFLIRLIYLPALIPVDTDNDLSAVVNSKEPVLFRCVAVVIVVVKSFKKIFAFPSEVELNVFELFKINKTNNEKRKINDDDKLEEFYRTDFDSSIVFLFHCAVVYL